MTDYTITLKNCSFFANHGVFREEEQLGQRFYVDAILDVKGGHAVDSDNINGTVNYGIAFEVIEHTVTGQRFKLIEKLALEIARELCVKFPQIRQAKITVRKPSAPIQGVLDHVAVTIVHQPDV